MKILYVPFSLDDAIFDLKPKAEKWCKDYQLKGKDTIVIYHGGLTPEKKEKIEKALESGDCQIYILSHGMKTPEFVVSNQTEKDEYSKEISIEEVAEHFKQDLMFANFSNKNVVKLFFCDEFGQDEKSKKMAEAFRDHLGEANKALDVKYYTDVSISLPGKNQDNELSSKKGMRAVGMSNPLFCFKLSCIVGSPKSFRQGLNEPENPSALFSDKKSKHPKITYPKYSHPLIEQLAKGLVGAIQADKILSLQQDRIIKELLPALPNKLTDYLVDGFKIAVENTVFEMKINKLLLNKYFQKSDASIELPTEGSSATKSVTKSPSNWVDPEDFFGTDLSFTELDRNVDFISLDDYEEVQREAQKSNSLSF